MLSNCKYEDEREKQIKTKRAAKLRLLKRIYNVSITLQLKT